jgi:hypothetical protein
VCASLSQKYREAASMLWIAACFALFACSDAAQVRKVVDGAGGTSGAAAASGSSAPLGGTESNAACVTLGEICRDDHAGSKPATTSACCGGTFCGPPICTDAFPSHCWSSCTCPQNGQSCRQTVRGRIMSEHACCDGLACTGCIDADAESSLCVCRPL